MRFDEDPQVLIRNALQPVEVDEVILCQMMGRAIVLVREDQLLWQSVVEARMCDLRERRQDIEIMTQEELEEQIEGAVAGYCKLDGVDEELANRLVGEGYLSYDDLSVIEPDDLMEMGGLNEEQVDHIVNQAEEEAAKAEAIAEEKKRLQREQARLEAESGAVATPPVTETPSATEAEASAGTNAEASPMPMLRPKQEAKSLLEMKSSVTGALGSPIVFASTEAGNGQTQSNAQKYWEIVILRPESVYVTSDERKPSDACPTVGLRRRAISAHTDHSLAKESRSKIKNSWM